MTQNEPDTPPIPGPGRRRLAFVLGIAATVGAAAALAVVVTAGGSDSEPVASTAAKPLEGDPPAAVQLPGAPVSGNQAVCDASRTRLGEADLRTKVACAVAGYGEHGAAETIATLSALPRGEAVVQLNLGLAQLWAGRRSEALKTLRAVREDDRYGYYGTAADNILHFPAQRPGYPLWVPPPGLSDGTVQELRAQVAVNPNQGEVWLALAARLQATDRGQAIEDARKAQALLPTSVPARIAVAVLGFDKDNPGASVGVLGPLTQQAPDEAMPAVRFHLGMLLWWLKQDTDAHAQWRQVVQAAPDSDYGVIAARLMQQIGQ
jgi:tetratricopeptide (TPR) repeat protein